MIELDKVSKSDFEVHRGSEFRIVLSDGTFPLNLTDVRPLPTTVPGSTREAFALTFTAGQAIRLPQNTYRLAHDQMGEMQIFLVQISPTEVEAIFT